MDYFSAYSLVLFSLYAIVVRIVDDLTSRTTQTSGGWMHAAIGVPFAAFFYYHVHFLHTIYFDYGYNMRVNLVTGITGSLLWLAWCATHYRHRAQLFKPSAYDHIKRGAMAIVVVNAALSLELIDFQPIWYTFDAHSLWHAATIGFPYYWFKYTTINLITNRNLLIVPIFFVRFLADEAISQSQLALRHAHDDIENHNLHLNGHHQLKSNDKAKLL